MTNPTTGEAPERAAFKKWIADQFLKTVNAGKDTLSARPRIRNKHYFAVAEKSFEAGFQFGREYERTRPTPPAPEGMKPTQYTDGSYSREYEEQPAPEAVEKIGGAEDYMVQTATCHHLKSLSKYCCNCKKSPTLTAPQPVTAPWVDVAIEAMAKYHWDENYASSANGSWSETREDNREWCREYVRDKHLPYFLAALAAIERKGVA